MALVFAAGAGLAQATDPINSPGCARSVAALQAQEDAVVVAGDAARARRVATLKKLREQAAEACLGTGAAAAPTAQRAVQPPIGVMPAAPAAAAPATVLPVPAATLPPARGTPLRTLTACDAAGCWTSDGLRLTRAGAMLVGPPGVCAVVGAVLSCR
jgi:hypothetical protein